MENISNSGKLSITFCGGVGFATGSNFLLQSPEKKILIDCGLFQGGSVAHELNRAAFPYDPFSIDILLITHAHADHIGRIPKLVKEGFRGIIYSTPETKKISEIMLDDTVKIIDGESRKEGVLPLYEKKDVTQALGLWKEISYHTQTDIGGGFNVYLKDAGHILGSTMYEIKYGGKKIVFTGDLGNSPSPLLKDTESITDADYLIMESVYGDRNHEPKDERRNKFKEAVLDVIKRNGTLVIPAFSLERTQVLLYELNNMVEDGEVPSIPVFLDSPLAIRLTGVYKEMKSDFNAPVQGEISAGDDIFNFPKLKMIVHSNDSGHLHQKNNPKIIIAGGGMSQGGRVVSHEQFFLPDPKNIILLAGYQAAGTLGRQLADGVKEVSINGERVSVKAEVRMVSGYSSHKDSDHLISFVESTAPTVKTVFVVMGEPKSSIFLVQRLRDYLGVNALYPEKGKIYELS